MNYHLVFECAKAAHEITALRIAKVPIATPHAKVVTACIVVGLVLAFRLLFPTLWRAQRHIVLLVAALAFAVLILRLPTAATTSTTTLPTKTVEGVVHDFVPMPYSGHAMERFCVQDACFEYSDYVRTGCFNQTQSHGGPIREGVEAKITYISSPIWPGNVITRLELAD
jgi:4-amino-4-deoxy-L-arabinose transferase-like glycosyltransferase